jgi:Xaa-Pro aminopeptidase
VLQETLPLEKPGAMERIVAAEIAHRMRLKGADGEAFETIVASGPLSALPHARPSAYLKKSEFVVLDLGAILRGYAADMTRTVHLGTPSRRARQMYLAVRDTQQRAIDAIRAAAGAPPTDAAARRRLARSGLAKYFTHSTGHGVGLNVHEQPPRGRGEKTKLEAGHVIAVEPGICLPGYGAIRIEDTVLLTEKVRRS